MRAGSNEDPGLFYNIVAPAKRLATKMDIRASAILPAPPIPSPTPVAATLGDWDAVDEPLAAVVVSDPVALAIPNVEDCEHPLHTMKKGATSVAALKLVCKQEYSRFTFWFCAVQYPEQPSWYATIGAPLQQFSSQLKVTL